MKFSGRVVLWTLIVTAYATLGARTQAQDIPPAPAAPSDSPSVDAVKPDGNSTGDKPDPAAEANPEAKIGDKLDQKAEADKKPSTPCDADAAALCNGEAGGGKMNSCLANREGLSDGCKKFRSEINSAFKKSGVKRVCKDDVMVNCQNIPKDAKGDAYKQCLKDNQAKLSDECKAEVRSEDAGQQ